MIAVNTNISALFTHYASRANQNELNEKIERVSSGLKLNRAADDPSGLAISQGMKSQLHGVNQAIGNAQDAIHLVRLADDYLDTVQNMMIGIRNTNVRLANIATLVNNPTPPGQNPTVHDCMELFKESENTKFSIYKMFDSFPNDVDLELSPLNYNGKNIFDGRGLGQYNLQRGFANGQVAQVGPDNEVSHRVEIVIDNLREYFIGWDKQYNPPANPNGAATNYYYMDYAQQMISDVDGKLDELSKVRTQLGVEDVTLQKIIQDLNIEYINVSGSRSRITDADMATEITQNTAELIKSKGISMIYQQANAQPLMTVPLLDVIYDGLSPKMVHTGPGASK